MTSLPEFNARAALCRQLAELEPDSKDLWLAEAEKWSRIAREPDMAVKRNHGGTAEASNWEVPKRPRRSKITRVRFRLSNLAEAVGKDPFEQFSSDISAGSREPN
jgi:hypothetical protein